MSVLWVAAEVPDRSGGGGNIRQANLLTALSDHLAVDLVVAGELTDPKVRAAVRNLVEVDVPAPRPRGRTQRRLAAASEAWFRRRPLEVADAAATVQRLRPAVRELAAQSDAVLVHHQPLLPLLPVARDQAWLGHLFHVSSAWSSQAAGLANGAQAALLRREASNSRRLERWAASGYDRLVLVSEEDRRRLGRPAKSEVIPHGVDLAAFPSSPVPDKPSVLLAGSLDYEPNIDGSEWFAHEVWPAVVAQVPQASLQIVGRRPGAAVLDLAHLPGVEVVPDVPSMAPWFAACRVAVVPLRIGTGTRVKLQEAYASGRPVVGTSVGLEGHSLGGGAIVRDEPVAFADAVVRLLLDDAEAASRGADARRVAESWPTWADAGAALAEVMQRAAHERATTT